MSAEANLEDANVTVEYDESKVSGVDSKVFFDGKSGYNIDDSFKEMTVVGIFIIHSTVISLNESSIL